MSQVSSRAINSEDIDREAWSAQRSGRRWIAEVDFLAGEISRKMSATGWPAVIHGAGTESGTVFIETEMASKLVVKTTVRGNLLTNGVKIIHGLLK